MSKSTRQSLTLLAVIGGCLFEMHRKKMFAPVEVNKLVGETYGRTLEIMEKWPDSGKKGKNQAWIIDKVEKWHRLLDQDSQFLRTTLAAICDQCLTDLRTVVKDPYKLGMLESLVPALERIHGFSDPTGANFPAYEEASRIMGGLYVYIEWPW